MNGPKKKKKLNKDMVTHKGKRMTTEEANVQHYQDQVRQAYADYEEQSRTKTRKSSKQALRP